MHRRSLNIICFGIIYLNRVLIIGEIICCCWWRNIWWFSYNGWYDIENSGGKEHFLVANVLLSLLTCNSCVVVSCSTQIFVSYVRMWYLYHFSTLNCVCHQILKILIIFNRLSGNLFIFTLIFRIAANRSDLFHGRNISTFSKVYRKKVYHSVFLVLVTHHYSKHYLTYPLFFVNYEGLFVETGRYI